LQQQIILLLWKGVNMSDMRGSGCGCQGNGSQRVNEVYEHMTMAEAPLAMAYVPYQQWETPFAACKGLRNGTIFSGLSKPFCGKGGKRW
jgi:hypothetical protein